jgi:hypothetical protein
VLAGRSVASSGANVNAGAVLSALKEAMDRLAAGDAA